MRCGLDPCSCGHPELWYSPSCRCCNAQNPREPAPATVSVHLDGLADKIAAWCSETLTWQNIASIDAWSDDQFAGSLLALLRSLAVQ
jgi:hypothetical protein